MTERFGLVLELVGTLVVCALELAALALVGNL
jgi:hypothetical protein